MAAFQVDGDFIEDEPGLYDSDGMARSFFYYRFCDRASDVFLDAVDVGEIARRRDNRSTYSATAEIAVHEPARRGLAIRFEIGVIRVGGKSITYEVRMLSADDGRLLCRYETVGVCMDMSGNPTTIPIPDSVREKLARFQI